MKMREWPSMVLSGLMPCVVGVHRVGVQGHVAGCGGGLQSTLCSSLLSTGLSGRSPRVAWARHPEPPFMGSCTCPLLSPACPGLHPITPLSSQPALPTSVSRAAFFHLPVDPGQALHVPLPAMFWLPGLPVVPLVSFIKFLAARALTVSHCFEYCTSLCSFSPH